VLANGGAQPTPHIGRQSRNGPLNEFLCKVHAESKLGTTLSVLLLNFSFPGEVKRNVEFPLVSRWYP
jgi:hypothetical protein